MGLSKVFLQHAWEAAQNIILHVDLKKNIWEQLNGIKMK